MQKRAFRENAMLKNIIRAAIGGGLTCVLG
jgi:hypothetical protein